MNAGPLLSLDRVEIGYGTGASVTTGLSFDIEPGQSLAVLGPNGAGKTTLIGGLMGLLPLRSGRIELAGTSIEGLDAMTRTTRGLVCVPEGRATFVDLTVDETLRLAGRRLPRARRAERIQRVLDPFPELRDRRSTLAGTLSGGEQQMLSIARALMLSPRLLVLDEPSLGLGRAAQSRLAGALGVLMKEGLSILLTDQDLSLSLALADRALLLAVRRPARIVEMDALRRDPALAEIYLTGSKTSLDQPNGVVVST